MWLLLQFVAPKPSAPDRRFGTTWCKFTTLGKSFKIRNNDSDPETGASLGSLKRSIWNIIRSQSPKPGSNFADICTSIILVLYLQHKQDPKQEQSFCLVCSTIIQPLPWTSLEKAALGGDWRCARVWQVLADKQQGHVWEKSLSQVLWFPSSLSWPLPSLLFSPDFCLPF